MRIDLTPEPTSNIIAIDPASAKELEIRLKQQERDSSCPGQHKQVEVDHKRRLLNCKHCGSVVDPFDYLLSWAREGERRMTGLAAIETRRKVAQAEHDDLMRRVRNLRSRLKRADAPQSREERFAYDQQRWNA